MIASAGSRRVRGTTGRLFVALVWITLAGLAGSYTANWSMTPAVNWHNALTSVVSTNATGGNTQITSQGARQVMQVIGHNPSPGL